MAYSRNFISRNRNSWGPMSTDFSRLELREEVAEECTERMITAQLRQLDPLKEDLADWLNKTLCIDYLNRDNFLSELDNGVILCHLAQVICEYGLRASKAGIVKGVVPNVRGKCFEKAMRRSFFSRDNVANFLKFCRSLGVHENLLFESDDLEVARLATRFGVEPPGLVQLEKEIAEEEKHNSSGDSGLSSLLSWQFQCSTPKSDVKMSHSRSASAISSYVERWSTGPHMMILPENMVGGGDSGLGSLPAIRQSGASDGVPSDNTEDEEWSRGSGEDPDLELDTSNRRIEVKGGGDTQSQLTTELDRRVQLAARLMQRNCNCLNGKCDKLRVRKVGEGKYNIAGKNVFIRLLKGRHMMVRVGGGWDTLDHFLLRHDPCQVKVVSRDSPDRVTNASNFLHIRAKYRSPPPCESVAR